MRLCSTELGCEGRVLSTLLGLIQLRLHAALLNRARLLRQSFEHTAGTDSDTVKFECDSAQHCQAAKAEF